MSGERVAVAGAGLMGAGIAQVFAAAGHDVALYDPLEDALEPALERVREAFALLDEDPAGADRVATTADLAIAVRSADVVIEAAPERLALKQELFAALDALAPADAILASNTSAIPIAAIAASVDPARRGRVLGAHFWLPPYLVALVEVVQADTTEPAAVERMMALLAGAGMKPVHVRADIPGFVGNRLQHALKREAIALVAAGVCDAETVDTVVKEGFGARLGLIGPLEQSDLVGLELTLAIHEILMPSLDVTPDPHPDLVARVQRGDLGARTGRGFREWAPGEAEALRAHVNAELAAAARRRRQARERDASPIERRLLP
jgi:3-hydroxybutyryl-CoA dehydrogenase